MQISDEAVEAAARAALAIDAPRFPWSDLTEETRVRFLGNARLILEAAAPHMLAAAWDSALQDADDQGYLLEHQTRFMQERNPYRTAP